MAADREITRTVTTKSTVPAGTAASGTATTSAAADDRLDVSGTTADALETNFSKFLNGYRNVWIYLATSGILAKVKGITKMTSTSYILYLDRDAAGVAAESFTIVIADLMEYYVKNNGAADSTNVDGATLKTGDAINAPALYENGGVAIQHDPIIIDGTGTSLVIGETK